MKGKWFAAIVLIIDLVAIAVAAGIYISEDSSPEKALNEIQVPALKLYTSPNGPVALLNGSIVGNIYVRNGAITSFHTNGSGYLNLSGTIPLLSNLTEGSISLLFRYEETDQNVLPILYFGDREGKSLFIIEIGHNGENNRRLYITWIPEGNKPTLCFDSGFNLKPGRWYHLVVVVSENGNTAYLNGREMTWRHYNFGNESMRLFFADIPEKELFTLGYGKTADSVTPEFLYFHGDIADLRIYPWPLSAEEALSILKELRETRLNSN